MRYHWSSVVVPPLVLFSSPLFLVFDAYLLIARWIPSWVFTRAIHLLIFILSELYFYFPRGGAFIYIGVCCFWIGWAFFWIRGSIGLRDGLRPI